MPQDMTALHQAVQRLEEHIATVNAHLDVLTIGHRNARGNPRLRAKIASEIEFYTRKLGALHAERDRLRRQIQCRRGT